MYETSVPHPQPTTHCKLPAQHQTAHRQSCQLAGGQSRAWLKSQNIPFVAGEDQNS